MQKVNRSRKGESDEKVNHEKVNHTWKGEWSYMKRWIIHEKVNHTSKGESYMKGWIIR